MLALGPSPSASPRTRKSAPRALLKPTTQDSCRLQANVLPGEERFKQSEVQDNISQALFRYLKQQNLMAPPIIPEMQRWQNNMDNLLYRAELGDYDKARQYMQLQIMLLT